MDRLGLGVVGLGEGRSIISAGVHSDLWEVVQLCDLDPELRARRCREFDIEHEMGSLDALLADPAVDVVGIHTPDRLHAEHTIRALRAGKHVICTKPFLDGLKQAGEVLAAQRESGRIVFVGQSARFFHSFARQRQHFETGEFGALTKVEAAYHADHRWFLDRPSRVDRPWLSVALAQVDAGWTCDVLALLELVARGEAGHRGHGKGAGI